MPPSFTFKNYWPSLLLSLVLLAGIGVYLKKLDCLAIEEVRALITIIFGSATSCLLLSFIWLIQRKPLNRPWPNQGLVLGRDTLPSMNPRGRVGSFESLGEASHFVSTISALELELPPAYQDALIHSKPLLGDWQPAEKISNRQACSCCLSNAAGSHQQVDNCKCCCSQPITHLSETTTNTSRKLLTTEQTEQQQQQQQQIGPQSSQRKISYIQLDVGQLLLSSSPPKYYELQFNNNDSNNSTHTSRRLSTREK